MTNPVSTGDTLVVGYGNELRRDDGAGCLVVRELAALALPGVRTRVVQQLVPELAAEMAEASRVFFVDALAAGARDEVTLDRLEPLPFAAGLGHVSDPGGLLSLTGAVYGRAPEAWLVAVAGEDFAPGEGLSARAAANARGALRLIRGVLGCG
jgi:hydrogenase maturation protease